MYSYGAAGRPISTGGPAYMSPQGGQPMPQIMPSGKTPFARGGRRNLNLMAIVASLLVPWGIFIATMAIHAFQLHSENFTFCLLLDIIIGLAVVGIGFIAFNQWKRREAGDPSSWEWFAFMFATSAAGLGVGMVIGNMIFVHCMRPYYDVTSLQVYPNVDVGKTKGQQVMDAGVLDFVDGTYVDTQRSMGFRNNGMYCVAPIVTPEIGPGNATPSVSYDFWAVGMNCCNGHQRDFHCGEYQNPNAKAGLRLMKDRQRAFFRLAVQQAEAAFNIRANHPLFFYFMQEPHLEMQAYQDDGYKWCLVALFSWLGFQIVAIFLNVVALSMTSRN